MIRKNLTPIELAYLAGIIDGEGTIGIARRVVRPYSDHYMVYFVVGNTDPLLPKILTDAFGGNVVNYKVVGNRKPLFRWELDSASAVLAIRVIAPYLRMKHEQARLVLEFDSVRTKGPGGKRLTQEEQNLRHSYWERLRALNHRGNKTVKMHPVRTISREVRVVRSAPSETRRRPPSRG